MSHNPSYDTLKYGSDIKKYEAGLRAEIERICWQEGGSLDRIKWMESKVFENYDAAYEWLRQTDNGWYDNRAVLYMDFTNAKKTAQPTKKYLDIKRRLDEYRTKLYNLSREPHFKDVKSETIACKNCGSRIASGYMKTRNNCPVCGANMLPPTTMKQLARYKEIIADLEKQFKEETRNFEKKMKSKAEKYWLIYYDYHT